MSEHQLPNLTPAASFLVERERGRGYQVTSAEGPFAQQWRARALALLDTLGQPDAKGPSEYLRWVGPVGPTGEYVGVRVELLPTGEARYHQAWFQVPKAALQPKRANRLLILVLFVGFLAGVFAGRTVFVAAGRTAPGRISGNAGPPGTRERNSSANGVPAHPYSTKLQSELAASRDLRTKLREYLSQEGFAADMSTQIVDEKRSVKLIADLDRAPPPRESIRLSNVEVAKLLNLLRTLDEWGASAEALPKSEGQ